MNLQDFNEDHLDHEVRMAKSELIELAKNSMELIKLLNQFASEERGIPGWVASKITKAQDYINSAHRSLTYDAMDDGQISEKAQSPYAVGMAQAMKSTGDKPPLKKSTIRKAHKIAKAVEKGE
jgi:hypothetical protein